MQQGVVLNLLKDCVHIKEVGNEAGACVLQMRTTTECSYLAGAGPEGMGPLQHVALFHSHDTSRGRGVYALAMPMEHRFASHHCMHFATAMAMSISAQVICLA